jgi:hypothetical protein
MMSNLFWLTEEQIERMLTFPLNQGRLELESPGRV